VSRVEALDLGALRARLILAIEGAEGLLGSPYLIAIGALYLACDPASPGEIGTWASLYEQQALAESVNPDELLDALCTVNAIVGDA
jgi:hypothetical protein